MMDRYHWTEEAVREIALAQSAVDLGCQPSDFMRDEPVIVPSQADPRARRYLELPFSCQLVSYGNNVVASVSPDCWALASEYIRRYPPEHCFETPHLHVLNDGLQDRGLRLCSMAEYFLPARLEELPCPYPVRLLRQPDFDPLYTASWSNALCEKRRELDVLGVGAYDGEALVGLAACSADCEEMWQIGVDVLPAYRRRGIAAALTSRLALEIFDRGKVPFYCAAWCNLRSVRNALHSGFRPAWVEMTARPAGFVEEQNRRHPVPEGDQG